MEGKLKTAVQDDREHRRSRTAWYLWAHEGRLPLHFGYTPTEQAGEEVRGSGSALALPFAVSRMTAETAAAASCTRQPITIGLQNTAVLELISVEANSAAVQRDGYLTFQLQSKAVVQSGVVLSTLGVSPGFGSGTVGQFTYRVSHKNGCGDIAGRLVDFMGSPACTVEVKSTGIALLDDRSGWLGPIPVSTPGQTLSNGNYPISFEISFTGSGDRLQSNLQMTCSLALAGAHRITGESWISGGADTGTVPLGAWTVRAVADWGFSPRDMNRYGSTNTTGVQLVIDGALGP